MNSYTKKIVPAALLIAGFTLLSFSGCTVGPNNINVKLTDFKVYECKSSLNSDVVAQNRLLSDTIYAETINNNTLKVWTTNTKFSCCASKITQEVTIEKTNIVINLSESEDGMQCNCLCGRSVEFLLNNLVTGQTYSVTIKRNTFDYYSFDFTFSNETSLTFNF